MKIRVLLFVLACLMSVRLNAQTISTFDVLVATETLTVIGTTTVKGNAFSVGNSTFAVIQGNVGIGTTTPSALFHIVGGPVSGTGAQFKWMSSSASLRVGEVSGSGTAWASSNIGVLSMAFGLDSKALGSYSSVGGGQLNVAEGNFSTVGGGYNNFISTAGSNQGQYSVIAGGLNNVIGNGNGGYNGVIGGGFNNLLNSDSGVIAGGYRNYAHGNEAVVSGGLQNTADGTAATVAGGTLNILTTCNYCTIGGGGNNQSTAGSDQGIVIAGGGISSAGMTDGNAAGGTSSAILGGDKNTATGDFSSISGGYQNTANANYSSVPGGYKNTAGGQYSFAAGQQATANSQGSFVWSDSETGAVTSNTQDEFRIRAGGGYVFLSTPTAPTIIVSSGAVEISTSATAATAVPNIFISSTCVFSSKSAAILLQAGHQSPASRPPFSCKPATPV